MNDLNQSREHEEIDLLLPWYVNGTLEPAERERVSSHLAGCKACKESIALLSDVQEAVTRNKATPMVPRPRINELLDAVNSASSRHGLDRRHALHFLTAAAVTLVLAVILVVTGPDRSGGTPTEFATATSGQNAAAMDYVLRIQFNPNASENARQRVLQDIGARDVSGGITEGSFRVIVHLSAASLEDLDRYTNSLESLQEVASVEVIALQLPMKSEP